MSKMPLCERPWARQRSWSLRKSFGFCDQGESVRGRIFQMPRVGGTQSSFGPRCVNNVPGVREEDRLVSVLLTQEPGHPLIPLKAIP